MKEKEWLHVLPFLEAASPVKMLDIGPHEHTLLRT
jgi:hypothetical protein